MHIFKKFNFYKKEELRDAAVSLSKKQLVVFLFLSFVGIFSLVFILVNLNKMFMVEIPQKGGSVTEGIVGFPILVNPVIANSEADKDLVSLIYSGLMRKDASGNLIPDLAVSWPSISEDGKEYTFVIKEDAKFHNGEKLTAKDVIFTIEKIKDPTIKSPLRSRWEGVEVEQKGETTLVFTTSEPYFSFLNNTTLGILPSELWKNVSTSDFNLSSLNNSKAIGSGPYKIKKVTKNEEGLSKKYELERFRDFVLEKPLIKYFNIVSFANEKEVLRALQSKTITQAGCISPENISGIKLDNYSVYSTVLPRLFGLFFNNKNNKIFADPVVIQAINSSIDRQDIIDEVLSGFGIQINNPIPEKIIPNGENDKYSNLKIEEINNKLEEAGWKLGEDNIRVKKTEKKKGEIEELKLSFEITTGNTPELKKVVELISNQLFKIGIEVSSSKIYETGQLNQLIKARDYEALFFGQIINHESDLYSFWHSSQISDTGLNIAMYSNRKVDSILESIVKEKMSEEELAEKYISLRSEFSSNLPAVLIYSPEYIYVVSNNINGLSLDNIINPSDRFASIYLWSANKEKVWKIFTKELND